MKLLEETIEKVKGLSEEELRAFRNWFAEFDAEAWYGELEMDIEEGKLEDLAAKALEDFKKGKCTEL